MLDPGRNDYYGHSGAWLDTQDSAWLVRLDSQAQLALNVSGPGSVSADVPGLQCSSSCTTTWNSGQRLALTATPAAGAKLVRWAGTCSGSAGCNVTVAPGTTLSALFAPATFRLTVAVTGKGAVRSSGAGIGCPPSLLGERRLVLARTPDRISGEGVEAQVLERRLPGLEEGLHGADERGRERPRDVRPRLTLDGFAPGLIR